MLHGVIQIARVIHINYMIFVKIQDIHVRNTLHLLQDHFNSKELVLNMQWKKRDFNQLGTNFKACSQCCSAVHRLRAVKLIFLRLPKLLLQFFLKCISGGKFLSIFDMPYRAVIRLRVMRINSKNLFTIKCMK